MAWVRYPKSFKLNAILSQVFFCRTVLYGYSPGPKKSRFMPVMHSNSVLAVPAPTEGTLRYPDGKCFVRKRNRGMGSCFTGLFSQSVGSKKDSSCTIIMLGVVYSSREYVFSGTSSFSFSRSNSFCPYSCGLEIPVLKTELPKQ